MKRERLEEAVETGLLSAVSGDRLRENQVPSFLKDQDDWVKDTNPDKGLSPEHHFILNDPTLVLFANDRAKAVRERVALVKKIRRGYSGDNKEAMKSLDKYTPE